MYFLNCLWLYLRRSWKVLLAIDLTLVIQIILFRHAGMSDKTIIKIQDLSENYNCLIPEGIMSIHWTQEKASCSDEGWFWGSCWGRLTEEVVPVVVLRKVDGILHEDHFTFISNDLTHDVLFLELCNSMIHTYYDERNINIEIDVEFNDGCASHFVYKWFNVLQGEMFHPFRCILKPVMGRANLMAVKLSLGICNQRGCWY